MSLFQRYLLKIFIKNYLIIQCFIYIIYMFFLFFTHSKFVAKYGASLNDILMYDIIKSPIFIYQTLPVSFIVAIVGTFVILLKNNELTAFLSLGGSVFKLIRSLTFIAILFTVIIFIISDYVVPYVQMKGETYKAIYIEKRDNYQIKSISNLWFKDEDDFIKISNIDLIDKKLYDIKIYKLNSYGNVEKLIYIDTAIFKEGKKWEYKIFKSVDLSDVPKVVNNMDNVTMENDTFTKLVKHSIAVPPKQLPMKELRRVIRFYKSKGLTYSNYAIFYYNKISYGFIPITLMLLILPFTIDISRNFSYIKVATNGILVLLGFWIFMSVMLSLGKSGVLNPFIANFSPHFFGLILAGYGFYLKDNIFNIAKKRY
ncbi:MAG: LptF/LptG family permease [Deferribacterales bacterium]